jgi:hypothetical protein
MVLLLSSNLPNLGQLKNLTRDLLLKSLHAPMPSSITLREQDKISPTNRSTSLSLHLTPKLMHAIILCTIAPTKTLT